MADLAEASARVAADLETRFDRINVAYKTVNNTALETAIFIPKTVSSSTAAATAPVLVHFHGGALITGAAPDLLFLGDWVRDFAHTAGAIFLSPAYRLAPETPAVEILDDIADFWTWLHAALPGTIRAQFPHLSPDLNRIAAIGESAGGYLALQSALQFSGPARGLRAVIAQYPGIFPDLPAFNPRPDPPDAALDAVVDGYVRGLEPGAMRVATAWPGLADLAVAALQNGRLRGLLGEDPEGRLTLRYALARAEEVPPAVWVIQGEQDTLVAKEAADQLVDMLKRERPRAVVRYTVREGDHAFDAVSSLQDEWLAEGVEFIKGHWLK
ncbi:Alpha/Beta hydrolase protein [Chaetomium fimeti]|uniref:Alpha/Beta hydrolase protein n=1 Tax=Chaetomium fimeti TaxID=1854472 RepID=A0AAE0HDQ4_9PEZI|nr:Alpha/Beta hydrolase protein [Chaetomium fimeti]